jgi:hypothetical protein
MRLLHDPTLRSDCTCVNEFHVISMQGMTSLHPLGDSSEASIFSICSSRLDAARFLQLKSEDRKRGLGHGVLIYLICIRLGEAHIELSDIHK